MAETAAILSPQKTVVLPVRGAWCPMAHMITPEQLRGLKELYPDAAVVCYVNSTAEIKAESEHLLHLRKRSAGRKFAERKPGDLRSGQESGGICCPSYQEADHTMGWLLLCA